MTKNQTQKSNVRFAFFGTGAIARYVAEELHAAGFTPALVVTAPDKPAGRKLTLTPSHMKEWADSLGLRTLQPEKIHADVLQTLQASDWDVFVVADYGLILPRSLLEIPHRGTLNMHPSLLPRLRGPSPIRSAILFNEKHVGVSIMLVDEEMDHGPIVAQRPIVIDVWPPHGTVLDELLAREGGRLLAQVLLPWMRGDIDAHEQNHDLATYSKKFTKDDGRLDLSADPYANLLKIRAFEGWPGTYAFFERGGKTIRVAILDAELKNGTLSITRVKPEGKNEMTYADFLRSGATPTRI